MIQAFKRLFRPRSIIQTRASHKAFRNADARRNAVHAQLARELGMQWKGRGHA